MPTDRLLIPGPPIPKARARMGNGHGFTPKRTADAELRIRTIGKLQGIAQREGPVRIEMWFHLPTKRRLDLDNCCKLAMDALNPRTRGKNPKKWDPWGAWLDDSQIVELVAHKALDRENPRTIIEISDAP